MSDPICDNAECRHQHLRMKRQIELAHSRLDYLSVPRKTGGGDILTLAWRLDWLTEQIGEIMQKVNDLAEIMAKK